MAMRTFENGTSGSHHGPKISMRSAKCYKVYFK
jgi:hypothetical protein